MVNLVWLIMVGVSVCCFNVDRVTILCALLYTINFNRILSFKSIVILRGYVFVCGGKIICNGFSLT